MSETTNDPGFAPGWYQAPGDPENERYYDGTKWVDQYRAKPGRANLAGQTKTSGMAIASLVLGLLWGYGVGSILAIIFGMIAKKNIREADGMQTGEGMATAGIVLGIIGVIGAVIIIAAVAGSSGGGGGGYNY
jgi:hypothetical protein